MKHLLNELRCYIQYTYHKIKRLVRYVINYRELRAIKKIANSPPPLLMVVLQRDAKFDRNLSYDVDYSIVNKLAIFAQGEKEVVLEWDHLKHFYEESIK